jgi:hypothetical protein
MSAFLGHTASPQSKTHQEQCMLKSSRLGGLLKYYEREAA